MTVATLLLALAFQGDTLETLKQQFESERDKPFTQRYGTLSKIGNLKTEEAAAFLVQVFETEKDTSIRSYALTSLGTCATPGAKKKLLEIARDAKGEYSFRSSALNALARDKSPEVLDLIKEILADRSPANTLRMSAYSALQQYSLKDTEPLWREALDDTQPTIRSYAYKALAPLAKDDKKLQEAARKDLADGSAISSVRTAAVEVWKAVGGSEMVKALLPACAETDANIRKAILEAFSSLTDEKAIEALYGGLSDALPGVRAIVARSLGRLKHAEAMAKLEGAIKDKDVNVRIAALEAVAERKDAKSEEILHKQSQRPDEHEACTAIGLLPQFPSDGTRDLLLKLAAKSRTLAITVAAIDALGDLKTPEALDVFEKSLKAKDWQVRAAAIRGLGKLKAKESIDLLIERMAKEDGRLLVDIGEALKTLTGKALGYSQGHWKDWWKVNRETFVFPEKAEGVGGAAGTTTFYGVPVLSKKIIFCLDISGSMSADAGGENRLEQAKKELTKVLDSLPKDTMVNLIFFDHNIEPWQKQLVAAKANLAAAKKVVKELKPRGGTNIYDTLEKAFEDPAVDTIYLLSDGSPGSGKFVNTDDICREIKKMNRSRQIVIHTISLGASPFMKRLAEENGGQYVEKK